MDYSDAKRNATPEAPAGPRDAELLAFIRERERIRLRREAGLPAPWTTDPVLGAYRFCNIRREHDPVTRWIADNWLRPHADDPDVFFAAIIARLVNDPNVLAQIGYPVPWQPERFIEVMTARKAAGLRCYDPAYVVATPAGEIGNKPDIQVALQFDPIWARRAELRPRPGDTLAGAAGRWKDIPGFGGGFYTGQFIADLKHLAPLRDATDWWTWARMGPGSSKGMNLAYPVVTHTPNM